MFIDTHTHIYLDQFKDDIEDVIKRCVDSDINKLYMPNIDASSVKDVKKMAEQYPNICIPMMGLHPCNVKDGYESELRLIKAELYGGKYVAVGEIGIDLYWDKTTEEIQIHAFKEQIKWAKELNLPIVIHSRDSLDLTISIVEEMQDGNLSGIFHCFNGTIDQAERIMKISDFYMGIGGVITFKNAGVDKVVEQLPLDKLVLETDAPYLTPVPYRGKRNESSYIRIIAEKLAGLKDISIEEVGRITTENASRIFPF